MSQDFLDSDTWSLDITFAKWFLPRFRRLREIQKEKVVLEQSVELEYDKIEKALAILAEETGGDPYWPSEEDKETIEEGLQSFAKNLQTMWW